MNHLSEPVFEAGRTSRSEPRHGRRVSVIVSTYNRAGVLADCLIALQRQSHPAFEVVVVVGPCTDATEAVLAEHGAGCKIVRCTERNLSRSRNLGIDAAAGEICAFIDDDAVAHSRWLELLDAAYADDAVGGAGGWTIDNTGAAFQCRYTVCDRFGNATMLDHVDPATRLCQAGLWMFPSLLGTNCSFRTEALRRIGGFDEVFEYMLDETDVCARLLDIGCRVVTVPSALVFHRYAESHVRDHRRIAHTQLAPSRSKAHFVVKHASDRMKRAEWSAELDRFQTDLRFSNRWHVDRALIGGPQVLRLNAEIETGLNAGTGSAAAVLQDAAARTGAAEAFRPFVSQTTGPMLRIALVSQGYPPGDTAGIARWTGELAQALVARGHEVHVITGGDQPRTVEYRRGVWVHAVAPCHEGHDAPPVELPGGVQARAAAVLAEARRIRRDFGLDVLSAPIWDVEGILCAAHLDVPVVTSLHTACRMVLPMKERWRSDLPYRLNHVEKVIQAETWLLAHSRLLLANSREIVRHLEELYGVTLPPQRTPVVPHGLAPLPMAAARPASDRDAEQLRILFVGRIERRKGLDLLLRALAPLWRRSRDVHLDVVGAPVAEEAGYTAEIEMLLADPAARGHVTLHGFVDEAALQEHYAACDLLVAPSRFESFGLIAIEAMRCGKPVIATAVGGLGEIVDHGASGLLVAPESVEGLRQALRSLLADGAKRRRMGRDAATAFEARFSSAIMAEQVEHCFAGLIAAPNTAPVRTLEAAA